MWGARSSGLDVKEELFDLEELLGRELGELGIGGDEGFENGLFVGDCGCHVVKVTVDLGEHGQASGDIHMGWHGGNAVDGGGCGGTAKHVATMVRSALLVLDCLLPLAGPGLQCWPCLRGMREAVPVKAELGEAASQEEQHRGNGDKPSIGDQKASTCSLFLCVFEAVDVFGEARIVGPPAEHGSLEMDILRGFKILCCWRQDG